MATRSKPVPNPIIYTNCRICGVRITNDPDGVGQSALFTVRPMLANPGDPAFTYVCPECDARQAANDPAR